METRSPAVAGMFYPGSDASLSDELDYLMPKGLEKTKALGVISPHAGYVYSGGVAGELLSSVVIPKKVILLGPNHTGLGTRASVMTQGNWSLPTGSVSIDSELAEKLVGASDVLKEDVMAHLREHSLEVQIPFLLHEQPDLQIVPITLMGLGLDDCREVGEAITTVIQEADEEILILASSDMTHYESAESAKVKDSKAIDKVLALDPEGLMEVVSANNISMCGVIPATIMLFAAKALGATKASLVRYSNSGDVSGDYDQVVGYAGMIVQ